jgi:pSer/pThr/pTyr-binding forkhead associated (FHA) protein
MWKLTIEDEEGKRHQIELSRDEYSIGRDTKSTLRLTERNISRQHIRIRRLNDGWVIDDLRSYNGSYVNGHRVVGSAHLNHGDLIQIGDYRLYIHQEAVGGGGGGGGGGLPTIVSPVDLPDRLVLIAGPNPGTEYPLSADSAVAIGRAEECAVSINHPSVSRVHAEIRPLVAGCYEIVDHGSANGVRINGTDLRRSLLEAGDLLELGDIKLRFVGRGQFYTPGADGSQQIAALQASSRPVARTNSSLKFIAAAGFLVLVITGGMLALRSSGSGTDGDANTMDVASAAAIEGAKQASAAGDLDGIKTKLAAVASASPARQSADFTALYAQWANGTIEKAKKETDRDTKRKLLTSVAQDMSAPAVARSQAADLLAKLDEPAADISTLPNVTGPSGTTPSTTAKNPSKDPGDTAADGPDGEAKARRGLEGKVMSGRASTDEVKMLIAICRHQGDMACVSKAKAFLNR